MGAVAPIKKIMEGLSSPKNTSSYLWALAIIVMTIAMVVLHLVTLFSSQINIIGKD